MKKDLGRSFEYQVYIRLSIREVVHSELGAPRNVWYSLNKSMQYFIGIELDADAFSLVYQKMF